MIRLWDDLNDRYAPPEVVRELARMALAAMDSEPVYQVFEPSDGVWVDVDDEEEMIRQRSIGGITRTLYTAPPAPVSINAPVVDGGEVYQIWSAGICQWVECDKSRYDAHASLPAQRRVLYTSDPESNSEPVALQPELAKVIYHFRDWNEGFPVERFKADYVISWMLANYPPAQPAPVVPEDTDELARLAEKFGAEVAWANEPNEFHHLIEFTPPQFRAAMLQAGNSPVIPDGYVMVPKEPTAEMVIKMRYHVGGYDRNIKEGYKAMLAVAPQLPGSESATVPGKWIPVSERMPEERMSVILWDAEIGEVTSGHYSHKTQTFYHCGDAIENEITHWMVVAAPQEVKGE